MDQRAKMWVGVAFAGGVAVAITAAVTSNGRAPTATAQAPQARAVALAVDAAVQIDAAAKPPLDAIPLVEVTAGKLESDYRENEFAADARYKGSTLLVSGIVRVVSKDDLGYPYIALIARGGTEHVKALMAGETGLVDLKANDVVRLLCMGAEKPTTFVQLKSCIIE